jgi:hypothetical protein
MSTAAAADSACPNGNARDRSERSSEDGRRFPARVSRRFLPDTFSRDLANRSLVGQLDRSPRSKVQGRTPRSGGLGDFGRLKWEGCAPAGAGAFNAALAPPSGEGVQKEGIGSNRAQKGGRFCHLIGPRSTSPKSQIRRRRTQGREGTHGVNCRPSPCPSPIRSGRARVKDRDGTHENQQSLSRRSSPARLGEGERAAAGTPHLAVRERMVGRRPLRGLVPTLQEAGRHCLLVGIGPRRGRKMDLLVVGILFSIGGKDPHQQMVDRFWTNRDRDTGPGHTRIKSRPHPDPLPADWARVRAGRDWDRDWGVGQISDPELVPT